MGATDAVDLACQPSPDLPPSIRIQSDRGVSHGERDTPDVDSDIEMGHPLLDGELKMRVSNWILTPDTPIPEFTARGGGKARNMARLSQLGVPVPEWLCVSTEAFAAFVKANDLEELIRLDPGIKKEALTSL